MVHMRKAGISTSSIREPANLLEWTTPTKGRLLTCGRPGRATQGRRRRAVDVDTIDSWIDGLPRAKSIDIVSLLGTTRDDRSEFDDYPFRSGLERGRRPSFQQWLSDRYGPRFSLYEFATVDARPIPASVIRLVTVCIQVLLGNDHTVVLMDCAGAERTWRICRSIGSRPKTP
jgi:hypothetical protein